MVHLNASHIRFIKGKTNTYSVIRSSGLTGTLLALYRMLYLKNNYCLYDSDRILYVSKGDKLAEGVNLAYERLRGKSEFDYITLFSSIENRVDFSTMGQIFEAYFHQHNLSRVSPLSIVRPEEGVEIIKSCMNQIKNEYGKMKLFLDNYSQFFLEEFKWMKSLEHTELEKYQNCERTGRKHVKGQGPSRLAKNSREREAIYKLLNMYNDKLLLNNMIDLEDRANIAHDEAEKRIIRDYTHIVVDESRSFTKRELGLISLLRNSRAYGETLYIYNAKSPVSSEAFLTKLSRISEISNVKKVKSFYFRKPLEEEALSFIRFKDEVQGLEKEHKGESSLINRTDLSIEKFEFISLKNKREFKFLRDITRKDTLILLDDADNQEVTPEEMKVLPVFSNIAAGEPILMNPEVEDTFYLPALWVKGSENHFILQVKGDSMINAGIEDGDHVVIKSAPSAQNRDIVAVDLDGNATLKRLVIKANSAVLMPENENYQPIPINEEGAHIIGIAVGIIKIN